MSAAYGPCKHAQTREVRTTCFVGCVAVEPYTHCDGHAHGNVTVEIECLACGARQAYNQNGNWSEESPWDVLHRQREQEREERISRLQRQAAALSLRLVHATQAARTITIDREGYLVVTPSLSSREDRAIVGALAGTDLLDVACQLREALGA